MKRNIISLIIALFAMTQAMAQTYDNLWKQASAFQQKDLPQSEIGVMKKIITKASASKDYGQLLAAEMRQAMLWNGIAADSLAPAILRMEKQMERTTDPVLKAVWNAALGKVYNECCYQIEREEEKNLNDRASINKETSKEYFLKALAQPELLAAHTSTEYVPLALKGVDGTTFKNDMLHLVGFEADSKEAYLLMHSYYNKVGNRGAACLCAFEMTQKDRFDDVKEARKSKYLNTIDSLIHVYQDIPEAGELAVEHFRFLEGATDAKTADKLNYINYALNRWGGWSRMNVLRNAQKQLTEPMFEVMEMPRVIRPSQQPWIHLKVRNLQNLKVAISRLNITADNHYDVKNEETYKMLLKKTSSLHQKDFNKQFYGHPNYEEVEDSIQLKDLPLGAYLMEVTSDNTDITPQRNLFYVSDLAVMIQQLPDDKHRYVVVNATSGQPVAGARIELYDNDFDEKKQKNKRVVLARLTTNAEGEAYYKNVDGNILISTNNDKYTPAQNIYLSRTRYYEQKDCKTVVNVYTDRAIYRPGQMVHATAVLAISEKGLDAKACPEGQEVKFELRDGNWKTVAQKTVKTDAYGTAFVDFELSKEGENGQYAVLVSGGKDNASRYFRVEEYKRPTFEIAFPKVNEKYTWGDTVVVKATAKTYAGVPVQGAKVSYTVTRRNQLWWWGSRSADEVVKKAEGITREDGTFDVEIPLEASLSTSLSGKEEAQSMAEFMRTARFFNFDVSAIVTDIGGESHGGAMSLPLGTKPTAFSVDLPKRIEADSLKEVTFSYRNSAGMEIASGLKYRFDEGEWMDGYANVPMPIEKMVSGVHQLEAICGQDSLLQKFTLFSMADTHPMEPTTHWSYQTAEVFPRDGKPVYLQVGSSENGVHIVYSIIAGNKLLEKGAWELGDSIVTLPFTYKEEYASGIVINYSFVKEGKCYTNMMRILRPLPEKKLNLTWKTFRNRLTPGQKEEWTLHVTTPDGKPAKAQLMSVLYDKSLDALQSYDWNLALGFYQNLPNCYWKNNLSGIYRPLYGFGANYPTKYYDVKELEVDHFDGNYFTAYVQKPIVAYGIRTKVMDVKARRVKAPVVMKDEMETKELASSKNTKVMEAVPQNLDNVQTRENLAETAFFCPALESDAKGNVAIKFTLPESITTWKFMGLAHDKEMRNGSLVDEAIAKKTVMVQPNMPRFLREGDKATIVAKVFNTSDKKVSGNARMQILDPETNKVVWQKVQKFAMDAEGSATLSFEVEGLKEGVYINKVVAAGNGFSDGEQHYLPVLSNRELITNTLPITIHEAGEKSFDLAHLFVGKDGKDAKDAKDAKVTVEYTNNPSWLMVKALPSISNPDEENAISLMSAIYANSIAQHIQQQLAIESNRLESQVGKLKKLQNGDGSFSWWKGMDGSRYMTTAVAEMMVRLNAIVGKQKDISQMLTSAINYLTKQTAKEVVMLKEKEQLEAGKNKDKAFLVTPSEQALHYLYIVSLDGRKLSVTAEADKTYLLEKLAKMNGDLSIYGKAKAAVVLAKNSQGAEAQKKLYRQKAEEYLQSVNEYSVYKPEMGRYFDTRKALYSWRDYKIPTQVSVIEAMQELKTHEKQTIEELQRWLLMEKRTQSWDTPVNAVDAVYAFMVGNEANWSKKAENAVLKLDGKQLAMPQDSTTLGYVKSEHKGKASKLTVDKKSDYTSWGAVYAEFKLPMEDIDARESGIKVTRKVVKSAKVGDKVKVILSITADRDYDFVQVVDNRAACLEPVNSLSGYQWGMGCYVSPKDDTTNFYFDRLSKGKHIVEMEYYVDRKGDYQGGSCKAQCTYSPEFGGRTETYRMIIDN